MHGVLVNNAWSLSHSGSHSYSNGVMQPSINYNIRNG
jgi:hypothetical protein